MKENKKEKSSILENAVADYKSIVEAADKNALDRLKKQSPKEFEMLLKEEIKNIKNKESVQESKKDVTKEPIKEGVKTDNDKESLNEMEEIDLRELSIDDIEEAYNEASSTDEFEVTADDINLDDIASELDSMGEMANEMEEISGDSDPYTDRLKELHKMIGEMIENDQVHEMKNNGGPDSDNIDSMHKGEITPEVIEEAIDPNMINAIAGSLGVLAGAGGLAALENVLKQKFPKVAAELSKLGGAASSGIKGGTTSMGEGEMMSEAIDPNMINAIAGSLGVLAGAGGLAALEGVLKQKFPKVADALAKMGGAASSGIKGGTTSMGEGVVTEEVMNEAIDPNMVNAIAGSLGVLAGAGGLAALENVLKQKFPKVAAELAKLGGAASSGIKGGTTSMGEGVVTEEEVVEAETHDGEEMDEAHGQSYSAGKVRAGSLPNQGAEYRDRPGHSRNRKQWSNESVNKFLAQKANMEKRMTSLIEENKKVTKELNEAKAGAVKFDELKADQTKLQEALVKYRDQLTEMAVFNTNLAHVNNILVNESLSLTSDEKKEVINKFKNASTINESESTYKSVLSEYKNTKKTIKESVEDKLNDNIETSSTQNIAEAVSEKTAYADNEHIKNIKKLMEYVDNHGKKKIL